MFVLGADDAGERAESAPARHLRGHCEGVVHGEDPGAGRRRPLGEVQEGPAAVDATDRGEFWG